MKLPSGIFHDLQDAVHGGMSQERHEYVITLPPREIFKWWLEWNGIIGYDEAIWNVVSGLKGEPCD